MPHKADETYFEKKKKWSEYKDQILDYYLKPYLDKVSKIGKPITIIDCFAGRGRFLDGSDGSPRIIANRIQDKLRNSTTPIDLIAIEKCDNLIAPLTDALSEYTFATVRHDSFQNMTSLIDQAARNKTVFLYIDPYAVEGLDWATIDNALSHIRRSDSSVELLLNFNAHAFVRRATATLGQAMPAFHYDTAEAEREHEEDWKRVLEETPSVEKLDKAVGQHWWKTIFRDVVEPEEQRKQLISGLCDRLTSLSRYACPYEIREKPHHTTPKYVLVFASRFPGAITLVNRAVVNARDKFVEDTLPPQNALFEMRSKVWVPEPIDAREYIRKTLRGCESPLSVKKLTEQVIIQYFGIFTDTVFKQQIKEMYSAGQLIAEGNPERLNDDSVISLARK